MSLLSGYEPARSCTGSPTTGARALMSWYLGAYAGRGGRNLGIYNCRSVAGTSTTSLHGEGRADDLGVPVGASWAQGLADQLRLNSAELGVQCVIYNRRIWSGAHAAAGWRPYTGANPHVDHLHVELSWNSARGLTPERVQQVLGGQPAPPSTPPTTPPPSAPPGHPTIRRGAKGDPVRELQRILNAWYPTLPQLAVDGDFGPATEARVKHMQERAGLTVDGIVGPKTWARLLGG
ncbi:peptidoglycan-binding domain-containing protein [Actinokineospora auranticolor]|uniref:Putative peptidoglycan binding protein n=1 Tax=Actinokineospora auranticolor TaxID=155976 RepID=A0A2S6GKW2_9PSEU|nr:peptidoglycan-binding domain-containing protein [Actinokineospora auranticolor]PPK65884.1 putative peptidoglycan binding protein [Actinokineospora auranticolor]